MATGLTHDFNMTRNTLIERALKAVGGLPPGQTPTTAQIAEGVTALNLILLEEDAKQTGQAKSLWALSWDSFPIKAGGYVYATGDELSNDIFDIVSVYYRNSAGDDTPLELISSQEYNGIADKDEVGEPEKAYFDQSQTLANHQFYIWPAPSSLIGTATEVTGTDGVIYRCISPHTSATVNQPITGTSYQIFWSPGLTAALGGTGGTWASGTDYTMSEIIRYQYKRPLFDFDNESDNPDFPRAWNRYLIYKLAMDLSPSYAIGLDERQWLQGMYQLAEGDLFGSTRPQTTSFHNKTKFF